MNGFLDTILGQIDRITRIGAWGAIAAIVASFWLIISDILMRALSGASLSFGLEYSGYLVALSFFWGAGWTLSEGGHIRVTLLAERLSPIAAHRLELMTSAIGFAMSALLAWALADWALGSLALGAKSFYPSATPLFWPQALLALGPLILALAFLARIIRTLRGEHP